MPLGGKRRGDGVKTGKNGRKAAKKKHTGSLFLDFLQAFALSKKLIACCACFPKAFLFPSSACSNPREGSTARIVIPYKPRYPEVHELLEKRRFCVLVAHRRFGKTVCAINHLIKMALTAKKPRSHFAYVAPFRNQAKKVAWDYLKFYTSALPGRVVNESELSVAVPAPSGHSLIRLFGADNPDSLRGLYFDGALLDEVAQMKPSVWEEIIQPALADRMGFAVFIGTPKGINLFSDMYHRALAEHAAGSSLWGCLTYPVTATNALPPEEVARLREELSPNKYRQEMLCDFSASTDDCLISLDAVDSALKREPDQELASQWPLVCGVDVARFGEDASVIYPRRGLMAMQPLIMRKKSNVELAGILADWISEHKPRLACIDQGQGTGVIDLVRELAPSSCAIVEVPFGSKAMDPARYANRRAEIWTRLRDWLEHGCLVCDAQTRQTILAELSSPTYSFDAQGRIRLEAKEEIRSRLKHSTDLGDALALTFAQNLGPDRGRDAPVKKRTKWNPFK